MIVAGIVNADRGRDFTPNFVGAARSQETVFRGMEATRPD